MLGMKPSRTCCSDGLHVLLVDDEPARLALRRQALERQGFEVRPAVSAMRAVDAVRSAWVADIVVIDLRLGEIASVTLLDLLRIARPWLPGVLVGGAAALDRPRPRDASVPTRWVDGHAFPLRLSAAILDIACRIDDRLQCPFHRLLQPLDAAPRPVGRASDEPARVEDAFLPVPGQEGAHHAGGAPYPGQGQDREPHLGLRNQHGAEHAHHPEPEAAHAIGMVGGPDRVPGRPPEMRQHAAGEPGQQQRQPGREAEIHGEHPAPRIPAHPDTGGARWVVAAQARPEA
jgi:CheY-like chemotaxis protein